MNINSGISKLQNYGFAVTKQSSKFYIARKNDKEIEILISDNDEIGNMYVQSNSLAHTKVYNISNALKTLGEMEATPRSLVPQANKKSSGKTPESTFAEYFDFWHKNVKNNYFITTKDYFPDDKIAYLNIVSKNDAIALGKSAFPKIYETQKSTRSLDNKRNDIFLASEHLWLTAVKLFQKNYPHIEPLRKVEISTSVPEFDDVQVGSYDYGRKHARNNVSCVTSIFSHTEKDAVNLVKAMVGDFANVRDLGVYAVSQDKDVAMEMFETEFQSTGPTGELADFETAKTKHKDAIASLALRARELELCEKKVEFAVFLSNLASSASSASNVK